MTSRRAIKEVSAEPVEVTEDPFHIKYRPKALEDMLGQDDVVKSLGKVVHSKNPGHAYLLVGPSGCGKTTLARILATEFKCDPANILEVDAASNSGIDAMKEVTSALRYQGFGDSPNRAIIIDECHALSKQAWQALLKPVEEPPAHVFFFFCTTETGKVPATIVTRCHSYTLKPIKFDYLMDLMEMVADKEALPVSGDVLELVARSCDGSARQALVMLSQVRDVEDIDLAQSLLESPADSKDVIDLCRMLVSRKLEWRKIVSTLEAIPDVSPESVRIVVVNYVAKCLMGVKSERDVPGLLDILNEFSKPFNPSDKLAPLLLAFGNLLYAD